jgi:hypothetical protein
VAVAAAAGIAEAVAARAAADVTAGKPHSL